MEHLSKKAKKESTRKVKNIATVAFGVSSLAFPLDKASSQEAPKSNISFSSEKDAWTKEELEDEKVLIEIAKKELVKIHGGDTSKTDQSLIEGKVNELKYTIYCYGLGMRWLHDNIKNPKYKKTFTGEVKESFPNLSDEEIQNYIRLVMSRREQNATDNDSNSVYTTNIQKYWRHASNKSDSVGAFYWPNQDRIYFPLFLSEKIPPDSTKIINYAIHECTHRATLDAGYLNISPKAEQLFLESFDLLSALNNLDKMYPSDNHPDTVEVLSHLSNFEEMYSYKKSFEYELEKLGIKYGEEFTSRHYSQVRELVEKGKLSYISMRFFFSIKPEMFLRVMNEIAGAGFDKEKNKDVAFNRFKPGKMDQHSVANSSSFVSVATVNKKGKFDQRFNSGHRSKGSIS